VSAGHLLATQIYRQQGDYAQALNEERAHRQQEARVRQDIHDSRQRVVQTHLDNRQNRQHLQQLAQHSLTMERLSYEDSLTGIANRRRFEQRLTTALDAARPDQPLCVAILDVDDFKTINDGFSHATGDEVLKTLAATLKGAVRDADLVARLGGDEFVVLFAHTDLAMAQLACARLQADLALAPWPAMPGRSAVAVSIGVVQAQCGDTMASLLRRGDVAMYEAKAAAGAASEAAAAAEAPA
jgi:diguanylate cyclase (GGDEF)-like protein